MLIFLLVLNLCLPCSILGTNSTETLDTNSIETLDTNSTETLDTNSTEREHLGLSLWKEVSNAFNRVKDFFSEVMEVVPDNVNNAGEWVTKLLQGQVCGHEVFDEGDDGWFTSVKGKLKDFIISNCSEYYYANDTSVTKWGNDTSLTNLGNATIVTNLENATNVTDVAEVNNATNANGKESALEDKSND